MEFGVAYQVHVLSVKNHWFGGDRFGVLGIEEDQGERRRCSDERNTKCARLLGGESDLIANACGSPN